MRSYRYYSIPILPSLAATHIASFIQDSLYVSLRHSPWDFRSAGMKSLEAAAPSCADKPVDDDGTLLYRNTWIVKNSVGTQSCLKATEPRTNVQSKRLFRRFHAGPRLAFARWDTENLEVSSLCCCFRALTDKIVRVLSLDHFVKTTLPFKAAFSRWFSMLFWPRSGLRKKTFFNILELYSGIIYYWFH